MDSYIYYIGWPIGGGVTIAVVNPLPIFSKAPSPALSMVFPQALALPFLDSLVAVMA